MSDEFGSRASVVSDHVCQRVRNTFSCERICRRTTRVVTLLSSILWIIVTHYSGPKVFAGTYSPGSTPGERQPTGGGDAENDPTCGAAAPPLVSAGSTVVIGDLHGDVGVLEQILLRAGITTSIGGPWALDGSHPVTLVQMGDMVDGKNRNGRQVPQNDSIAVVRRIMQLQEQASAAGGGGRGSAVVPLLGNHELMNLQGKYRYVSDGEMSQEGGRRGWAQHFKPQSDIGRWLRSEKVKAVFRHHEYVFTHAGLLPRYLDKYAGAVLQEGSAAETDSMVASVVADTLDRTIKDGVVACVDGSDGAARSVGLCRKEVIGPDSPFWTREAFYCEAAEATVQRLRPHGIEHLVVGHTFVDVHAPPNAFFFSDIAPWPRYHCRGDTLVAVDAGLSTALSPSGGKTFEFLEIVHHSDATDESARSRQQAGLSATFSTIDLNRDNKLHRQEFTRVFFENEPLFQAADINSDGFVNEEEFVLMNTADAKEGFSSVPPRSGNYPSDRHGGHQTKRVDAAASTRIIHRFTRHAPGQ